MNLLHRRGWLLLGTATLFAGGLLGVACGPNGFNGDGGVDSGKDGTILGDSGQDGAKPDGGGNDAAPTSCEAGLGGSCDIVAQNCGTGKECGVVKLADGGYDLECIANSTGSIKEGYACTQANNNPCVAGLECIAGRCAKHCCLGDDTACGTAHPEGNPGHCDLTVTVNGSTSAYAVCTYATACEPFQIQPCTTSQTCIVKDSNGTATCSDYASPDGGLNEKATCQYLNDCKDGLGCYGNLDGGSGFLCQYNCYVPPGPFDAGITSQGAGKGGCPSGESCKPINWGGTLPTWLGICGK